MSKSGHDTVVLEPTENEFFTLPSRYYTDADVFELEKRAIFGRTWQFACHTSEIPSPGDYLTVDLLDEQLVFIRGDDQTIRGFHNVCRHRAHRLLGGRGSAKDIVCPYHAWRYARDGGLQHARNTERVPCFDARSHSLVPVKTEIFVDFVMYNLDQSAASFVSLVPGLCEEIQAAAPWLPTLIVDQGAAGFTSRVPMACNWKVLVDNCVECYHCTPAHQAFVDLVTIDEYKITLHERHTSHTAATERPDNVAYKWQHGEHDPRFFFWHVWPNLTFGIFPGSPNFGVFQATPIDHQTTNPYGIRMRLAGDESEHEQQRRNYVDNVLWPEDLNICESIQRGLKSSSYDQGLLLAQPPHGGNNEGVCHHFQKITLETLRQHG